MTQLENIVRVTWSEQSCSFQHLPEPQELAPVLSMCSQASAWGVAAQLCRRRRLYAQAFRFHLRHLVQQGHGEDQLQDGVAAAVSVYLRYK